MKSILGFRDNNEDDVIESMSAEVKAEETPIRSLVRVRLSGYGPLTYYNDQFDLRPGDLVYVSGKLEGKIGKVESVSTKFRIRKSDYEKVIRKLDTAIRGDFAPADGFMVSGDPAAISPARFRSWVIPPESPKRRMWYVDPETGARKGYLETGIDGGGMDDEIIVGDGFELSLIDLEEAPDVRQLILDRAKDYVKEKQVKYIHTENGAVKAYVLGENWYEVEFSRNGDEISGLYCDCPYPGLCKHAIAVLLSIRDQLKEPAFAGNYTAMENDWFWSILAARPQKITL